MTRDSTACERMASARPSREEVIPELTEEDEVEGVDELAAEEERA